MSKSKQNYLSTATKEAIAQQARGCCEYCQSQVSYSPDPFSIEHITARSKGGTNQLSNLAFSCQGCNNNKHVHIQGVDPASGETVLLFHPRLQRWRDHFTWNDDFTLVIGKTSTGRATVERLKLNRPGVVNLRRALGRIGEHPPLHLLDEEID
jgi:hypothetical protein